MALRSSRATSPNPSETGGWLVGDLDFCEHLDTYRGRKVVVIIADCEEGDTSQAEYTCGICGFVMNEARECPRCKMQVELDARAMDARETRRRELWDEIDRLLDSGLENLGNGRSVAAA